MRIRSRSPSWWLQGGAWLLAPLIGTLVDRMPRRTAMVGADLVRSVGLGLLCAMVMFEVVPLPAVAVLAFVAGIAEVFFDSAAQAVIPVLAQGHSQSGSMRGSSLRRQSASASSGHRSGRPYGRSGIRFRSW